MNQLDMMHQWPPKDMDMRSHPIYKNVEFPVFLSRRGVRNALRHNLQELVQKIGD